MNFQPPTKKTRPGRLMLRAAGQQFLEYQFLGYHKTNLELLEEEDINFANEIESLKKRTAPKLSDEYTDDY